MTVLFFIVWNALKEHETIEEIAERLHVPVADLNPKLAKAIVIHGQDLRNLSEQQLDDILRYTILNY